MKDELLPIYHEGVAGIVPPLETDDYIGELGQQVDDLPLALVPPLSSYHDYTGHIFYLRAG